MVECPSNVVFIFDRCNGIGWGGYILLFQNFCCQDFFVMVSGSDCPCPRRWDNSLYLVIVYHVSLEELIRPGVLPGLGALLGLGAPSDWEFSNSWGRSDADVRVIKTGGTLRDLGLGAPPGLELRPAWSSSWLESFARPGGSARPRSFSNPKEGSM